jgi:hypothetical protein
MATIAMSLPSGTHWTKITPTTVSTSLEGLEISVPPSFDPHTVSVNKLWLSKPLPKLPERISNVYSRDTIIDSYIDEDDRFDDAFLRPPSRTDTHGARRLSKRRANTVRRSITQLSTTGNRRSLTFKAFLSEEQYGVGMHMARANHYFREKKWEMFPELAPQSVTRTGPAPARSHKWEIKLKRRQGIYHGLAPSAGHGFQLNLQPIRDYVQQTQQTLVKKTSNIRLRKKPSQVSVSLPKHTRKASTSSTDSDLSSLTEPMDNVQMQRSLAEVRERMRAMSLWSHADSSEENLTAISGRTRRQNTKKTGIPPNPPWRLRAKHRSPTRFGTEKPRSPHYVNFTRQYGSPTSAEPRLYPDRNPLSPTSTQSQSSALSLPECTKALQKKTSHVFSAIDGAKKKIAESRASRRREELKKHIRIIGPIEHYPDGTVNQWL